MTEYEKNVRKILKDNGYQFARRGKGDHDIWKTLRMSQFISTSVIEAKASKGDVRITILLYQI